MTAKLAKKAKFGLMRLGLVEFGCVIFLLGFGGLLEGGGMVNCVRMRRSISVGQRLAGRFFVGMSALLWLCGGLALPFSVMSFLIYLEEDISSKSWILLGPPGAVLVCLLLMLGASMGMQMGATMLGKVLWGREENGFRVMMRKAVFELVSVCGLLILVTGLIGIVAQFFQYSLAGSMASLAATLVGGLLLVGLIWFVRKFG